MYEKSHHAVIDRPRSSTPGLAPSGREVIIMRTFAASPERLFGWWTKPELLMRWWAPKGWSTPASKVDLRPGGLFHYCMRAPDGSDFWGRGIYREIAAPQRLVYADSCSDREGRLVEPVHYGLSAGYPSETLVTVTFSGQEGKTRITLLHDISASVFERGGIQRGWTEMLERLDAALGQSQDE
jgi:uncharacterized protein YndB with AHSA1/START domain